MLLRLASATILVTYTSALYFLSFLGPVLVINHLRALPIAVLLAIAIVGFGVAGVTFLLLLIATKHFLIGTIESSHRTNFPNSDARKWFAANVVNSIHTQSPFAPMTMGVAQLASWYYRGMGAKIMGFVFLGVRSRISDPWFVELGENVVIGAEAVILGHLGHGDHLILGRVVIGNGVVIGMRAVIFPDVRIGKHARVGAGAVVVRGTTIADGETWAGVPARKISSANHV